MSASERAPFFVVVDESGCTIRGPTGPIWFRTAGGEENARGDAEILNAIYQSGLDQQKELCILLNASLEKVEEQRDELLEAAKLFLAFYDDLSKSNPGFMGKLCLQDYARWNKALTALPRAIAKVEGK